MTLQTPVAQAADHPISTEWELDCFSRPVVQDGKKLWELLVVDSTGQWREAVQLPATGVNSVAVREAVEGVIARAPVKPTVIRFFQKADAEHAHDRVGRRRGGAAYITGRAVKSATHAI